VSRRAGAWLLLLGGLAVTALGALQVYTQATAPTQPWSPLLHDNVVFAKSLPFLVGLGLLLGTVQALLADAPTVERRPGAIRRFAPGTALAHWINALGFLVALATGSVQYMTGIVNQPPPLPLWLVYRFHYVGASLMVVVATTFVTQRLLTADYRLLPARGRWARNWRGLAGELPPPLGRFVIWFLGLRRNRPPPPVGQFTYYEKTIDFPIWTILLTLILVTGVLKAMRYAYPLPGEVVHVASVVHVATMVLLALKLLDHLRYMLTPSRWPLLWAMITTWVSADYVRRRHPAWYAEVEASSPSEPPSLGEPAPGTARPQGA
jgi:cytochrome b subunit of formate dehydrogenase